MLVRLTNSFSIPLLAPFLRGDVLDVDSEVASKWIEAGRAIPLAETTITKREKAIRKKTETR